MIRLSANVDWLWKDLPIPQRLEAAQRAGFHFVESLNPYGARTADWKVWLEANQLALVLLNTPAGSSAKLAVRGLAAWPGKEKEFRLVFEEALTYAVALKVPLVHATAGPLIDGASVQVQQACYEANLTWACAVAQQQDVKVTIEPLSQRDSPGAFLASLHRALATIKAVGHPSLKLQFDLYHQQILQGDIVASLRACIQHIGHIQVAGVPDRGEPDRGELHFDRVAQELLALGYQGFVGCEYRPQAATPEIGLAWAKPYLG